jgi:hypothetical protein
MRKLMPRRRRKQRPKPSTTDTPPNDTQDDHWEPFDYQASAAEPSADRFSAESRFAPGCPDGVIPQPYDPPTPAESITERMHQTQGGTPHPDLQPVTCDLQPATCNLQPVTCDL